MSTGKKRVVPGLQVKTRGHGRKQITGIRRHKKIADAKEATKKRRTTDQKGKFWES